MITISIVLLFIGCLLLYFTSKNIAITENIRIKEWFIAYRKVIRVLSFIYIFISLFGIILMFNVTKGLIVWCILLSIILSLLVLITPLKIITYKHIITTFIIFIIIELVI